MNEIIELIITLHTGVSRITCERCRYVEFSNQLDKLNLTEDQLHLIKDEIETQDKYKKEKWTKIFKPTMMYVGAPMYAAFIASFFVNNNDTLKDFWINLFALTIVFFVSYIAIGGIIASIIYVKDARNKSRELLFFLGKYIRSLKFKKLTIK